MTNEIIREALRRTRTTCTSSPRSAPAGTPRAAGRTPASPQELKQRCTTTSSGSDWRPSTWSTCGWAASTGPEAGSIAAAVRGPRRDAQEGLIRHLGVSTVTAEQVAEAQSIAPVVCVQNFYNLAHREDDELVDSLAEQGIAYVPYFPLGGFTPLQSEALDAVAERLGRNADVGRAGLAAAALAQHPADPRHVLASRTCARTSRAPASSCPRTPSPS